MLNLANRINYGIQKIIILDAVNEEWVGVQKIVLNVNLGYIKCVGLEYRQTNEICFRTWTVRKGGC